MNLSISSRPLLIAALCFFFEKIRLQFIFPLQAVVHLLPEQVRAICEDVRFALQRAGKGCQGGFLIL